jgi:hypothetical protein
MNPRYSVPAVLHRDERRMWVSMTLGLIAFAAYAVPAAIGWLGSGGKWFAPIVLGVIVAILWRIARRSAATVQGVRERNGYACTSCGYPFGSEMSGKRCPECGSVEDPEMARAMWARALRLDPYDV